MDKTSFVTRPDEGAAPEIVEGLNKYKAGVVMPIIAEGDSIGSVVLLDNGEKRVCEIDEKLADAAAGFLGKQMEL